jgi:hypothetical protein
MNMQIALFVYNRLEHTKNTINALKRNDVSNVTLYVFSDGFKNSDDEKSVNQLRLYLKNIEGFSKVIVTESNENKGLAKSIISGVTSVLKKHETVIVLEDDLVVSPYFVDYMRNGLLKYKDDRQVMSIAGYSYPIFAETLEDKSDTYFLKLTTSWGWGTWKDSWDFFEKDVDKIVQNFSKDEIKEFNINNSENYWKQVLLNKSKVIDTWAIFWYAAVYKNNGLTLFPKVSMVDNTGHDGSGTNCGATNRYDVRLNDSAIKFYEENIKENKYARNQLEQYFKDTKISFMIRAINYVKRKIK